jgi:hypothetical protein
VGDDRLGFDGVAGNCAQSAIRVHQRAVALVAMTDQIGTRQSLAATFRRSRVPLHLHDDLDVK